MTKRLTKGALVQLRAEDYPSLTAVHGYLWVVSEDIRRAAGASAQIIAVKSLATGDTTVVFASAVHAAPTQEWKGP